MRNVDTSDPEIRSTWDEMTAENSEKNYLVLNFADKKTLKISSSGTGGIEELRSKFDPDEVMFAILKVDALDVKKNVTSRRTKFIFLTWIGPNVSVLKKARVSIQSSDVKDAFPGLALQIDIYEQEDLDAIQVVKNLLKVGGAHTPTHYKLGPNIEISVSDLK